jgi:hypothetical protein
LGESKTRDREEADWREREREREREKGVPEGADDEMLMNWSPCSAI